MHRTINGVLPKQSLRAKEDEILSFTSSFTPSITLHKSLLLSLPESKFSVCLSLEIMLVRGNQCSA
jgi:hypothetical protein